MQAKTQEEAPKLFGQPRERYGKHHGFTHFLIFLLLIGGSILLFRQPARSTTHRLPTKPHWQQVLSQYTVESLVTAPSDPTTLYACALPALPAFNPNELFTPTALSQKQPLSSVFLRSSDAGAHWQMLNSSLGNNAICSIAINPINAHDLYISIVSLASPNSSILKHSRDGGQTWTTIQATLTLSPSTQNVAWEGGKLSFIGNRLFAAQRLKGASHLISSIDGGQTWTILDANLAKPHQEMLSYVVDPTATTTLYELVGVVAGGWFSYAPSGATPSPMPSPIPADQLVRHLYKTIDGGTTWQEILSSVPYGSSLQLASNHPNLLYIGGLVGKVNATSQSAFHMQASEDGGITWHSVAVPVNTHLLNNWLVDAYGQIYVLADNSDRPHTFVDSIQRYNPSDQLWSTLAVPATDGVLLAVTATTSNGDNLLWFARLDMVYRGTLLTH